MKRKEKGPCRSSGSTITEWWRARERSPGLDSPRTGPGWPEKKWFWWRAAAISRRQSLRRRCDEEMRHHRLRISRYSVRVFRWLQEGRAGALHVRDFSDH